MDKTPAGATVLEPLSLPDARQTQETCEKLLSCVLCDETFGTICQGQSVLFLQHLVTQHKFVIGKVEEVCKLPSYCLYWKKRFKEGKLEDFCVVINTNTAPKDKAVAEQYYMLSDVLPEDRLIREELKRKELEGALECQQQERTDSTFSRGCLFCRQTFEGNRTLLFSHMADDHGFNVGLPDNIVHVHLFLDTLEEKLKNLQCLYCEKTFGGRQMLKDHMRKKRHKRLNPKNKLYDKFYIINYLELGKTWEEIQNEEDEEDGKQSDEDWGDWTEEEWTAVCLFCEHMDRTASQLITHMKDEHDFHFPNKKEYPATGFYQQVKVVNYIRRQVHQNICIYCQKKFEDKGIMKEHMKEERHFKLPPNNCTWDQPQYFFPTYENDALLCCLDDDEDESNDD